MRSVRLPRCFPPLATLRLECLETRVLLASGDPAAENAALQAAVVSQTGVDVHLEISAQDHTLVLKGLLGTAASVTLDTDRLGADIDRIAADHLGQLILTGSHVFEVVELHQVSRADLGNVNLSVALYADNVGRVTVNTPNLFAVVQGGLTILRSERFDNALILTDAVELRLSSTHTATGFSVVTPSGRGSLDLDFSVNTLNLANFASAPRFMAPLPPDPAPVVAVVTLPPAVLPVPVIPDPPPATPIAQPPTVPTAVNTDVAGEPDIPGEGLSPLADPYQPSLPWPSGAGAEEFGLVGPSSGPRPGALAAEEPSAVSASTLPVEAGGETADIHAGLPDAVSARLPEKLAALALSGSTASAEIAAFVTQAMRVTQAVTVGGLPEGYKSSEAHPTAPVTSSTDAEASAEAASHPNAHRAPAAPADAAPASAAPNPLFASELGAGLRPSPAGQDAELADSRGDAPGDSRVALRAEVSHSNRTLLRDIPIGDGNLRTLPLSPATSPGFRPGSEANATPASRVHQLEFWDAMMPPRTETRSWLWPYRRVSAPTEFKALVVDHLLAEFTPGERPVLLLDPLRSRSTPFALV